MYKRILTGVIGLPLMAFVMIHSESVLILSLLLIALVGQNELHRAYSKKITLHLVALLLTTIYFLLLFITLNHYFIFFIIFLSLLLLSLLLMVVYHKTINIESVTITIFGFLYLAGALSSIYFLRNINIYIVWLPFIAAWGCDTGAYFIGKKWGKRKLCPSLSPSKTWEGAIGGSITACILAFIYALIVYNFDIILKPDIMIYTFTTLIVSIFSQIGDLAASKIKRQVDIKDFGKLFPGHGGVLDRFDSILLAAPVVYIFAIIFWRIY